MSTNKVSTNKVSTDKVSTDKVKPAVKVIDNVNHPTHYTAGNVECIDAIQSALTEEEFRGYCKGSTLAYIWRERNKGGDEDLGKAGWYLERLSRGG